MDLFCNVDSGVFQTSITNQQPIQFLTFKRRDTVNLNLYFVKNGASYDAGEISGGLASFSLALKSDGDYSSAFLAYAANYSSYNDNGFGTTYYTFNLNLNTSELYSLFTANSDAGSLSAMLEFQWVKDSDNSVYSSQTLPVLVQNDVIRGDEPVIALANPSYPSATSVFSYGAFASASAFPEIGVVNKIYQAQDTNFLYTWTGFSYSRIQSTILTGTSAPVSTLGLSGDLYYDSVAYNLYQKGSTSWTLLGNLKGSIISLGTVSTNVGSAATATITGTAPFLTLNLGLPATTLSIGTVSTNAGSAATASITGTAPSQTLNLGLPATTLSIGSVSTGAAGTSASASITGTAPTQSLALTIPRGSPGTGATAVVSSSNFTAATGTRYVTTATLTVSDPASGSTGDNYQVIIGAGTCTIGGVAYAPSRLEIVRYYNGSAWTTSPSVHSDNLTLNGTANSAPNQTASSASSLMTRTLVDKEAILISPYIFQLGAQTTGSGGSATNSAGYYGLGSQNMVLGAATSSYARSTFRRGSVTPPNTSGVGIVFNLPLSISGTFMFDAPEATSYARFLLGGNGGTPATSDANAFSALGQGFELYKTGGVTYARIIYYNSAYVAGSWTSVSAAGSYNMYTYILSSDGSGNISLSFGNPSYRSTLFPTPNVAISATGGPTGNSSASNSYFDIALVGSSSVASSTGSILYLPQQTMSLG